MPKVDADKLLRSLNDWCFSVMPFGEKPDDYPKEYTAYDLKQIEKRTIVSCAELVRELMEKETEHDDDICLPVLQQGVLEGCTHQQILRCVQTDNEEESPDGVQPKELGQRRKPSKHLPKEKAKNRTAKKDGK